MRGLYIYIYIYLVCHEYCSSCSSAGNYIDPTTGDNCSCNITATSGVMSDGSQCVCDITHGFYVNNSAPYSCVPCHTLCLRCYDNSYDTCNECIQATNPLVKALSGNLCECNDGYYFNTSTTTCLSNSLYIYIYIYIYI